MTKNPFISFILGFSALLLSHSALAADEKKPEAATPAAVAEAKPADPVAVVNGVSIPQSLFEEHIRQRQLQGVTVDDKSRKALIEALVAEELLVQEAAKQNLPAKDPQLVTQLEIMRRNLLATAVVRKMLDNFSSTEEDYQKVYQARLASMAKKEYKARHILVDSEDKAKELIAELKGGADFSALAKANSSDNSATNGGDLGWFTTDIMPAEFGMAVAKLEKGKFSDQPVKTRFGWHVILLDDVRNATPPSLDEMRPQLSQVLKDHAINDYLNKLKEGAKVEIK